MLFMECLESDKGLKQEEGVEKKLAVSMLHISYISEKEIVFC